MPNPRALVCAAGGHEVPCHDGIADFVGGRFDTALDAEAYDHDHGIQDSDGGRLYDQIRTTAGDRWPGSLGSVIEIGCGTGLYSRGLLAGSEVTDAVLTDVSVAMLRRCRLNLDRLGLLARHPTAFATYSSHEQCLRPKAFDTCVGTSVLHHIPDPGAFLTRIAVCLRPGGRAFFLEPCRRFYLAFARAWADIATLILREHPESQPALQPLLNWLAEQRKAFVHRDDPEFLETLEDKHQFTAERIEALGFDAGFAVAEAIPFGSDPTGVITTRAIGRELGLDAGITERVVKLMGTVGGRYMDLLGSGDATPSLLIWFTAGSRAGRARPPATRTEAPAVAWDTTVAPTRCYLALTATHEGPGVEVLVRGWCLSNLEIKSVRVSVDDESLVAPVWLPRPDVTQAMPHTGLYAPWNALCCGVETRLTFHPGRREATYPIAVELVHASGATTNVPGSGLIQIGKEMGLIR
jgi:SAM-dependent methyltransferase